MLLKSLMRRQAIGLSGQILSRQRRRCAAKMYEGIWLLFSLSIALSPRLETTGDKGSRPETPGQHNGNKRKRKGPKELSAGVNEGTAFILPKRKWREERTKITGVIWGVLLKKAGRGKHNGPPHG